MSLTSVGSLNLTVAIIDRQFTQSFITGKTKEWNNTRYSRKLYECLKVRLPLCMMCGVGGAALRKFYG